MGNMIYEKWGVDYKTSIGTYVGNYSGMLMGTVNYAVSYTHLTLPTTPYV